MSERVFESGPGFVRAKECPDCNHTRCSEDCVCNCDAARAEVEADHWRMRAEKAEAELAESDAALVHARELLAELVSRLKLRCDATSLFLTRGAIEELIAEYEGGDDDQ